LCGDVTDIQASSDSPERGSVIKFDVTGGLESTKGLMRLFCHLVV